MTARILVRSDNMVSWAVANPVLELGEIGYEVDFNRIKTGNGMTAWNDLPYTCFDGGNAAQLGGKAASTYAQKISPFVHLDANLAWDFSLGDKAITPTLSTPKSISIANVSDGACGMVLVYGSEIILPSNSVTSADFDYLTIGANQHYLYTFVYDGTTYHWSRAVYNNV